MTTATTRPSTATPEGLRVIRARMAALYERQFLGCALSESDRMELGDYERRAPQLIKSAQFLASKYACERDY